MKDWRSRVYYEDVEETVGPVVVSINRIAVDLSHTDGKSTAGSRTANGNVRTVNYVCCRGDEADVGTIRTSGLHRDVGPKVKRWSSSVDHEDIEESTALVTVNISRSADHECRT